MHAAAQSDVIIRDPATHQKLPHGETGLIQVFSSIQKSYPGHSILTEDGRTRDGASCACGRTTTLSRLTGVYRAPKSGVAAMPIHDLSEIDLTNFFGHTAPLTPMRCSDPALQAFCQALSSRLLRDPASRQFPDVMTFGYFCRKSSISKVVNALLDRDSRLGWGTVLHIAPANIPVNFAFSFLMGFLSGNSNYVRVPTTSHPQVDLIVDAIDNILVDPVFENLRPRINFFTCERDHHSAKMVGGAAGLVVWGGDTTVAHSKPWISRFLRSSFIFQIEFPLLSCTSEIIGLDEDTLTKLCERS